MHRRFLLAFLMPFVAMCLVVSGAALAQPTAPNLTLNVRWGATGNWNSDPSSMILTPDPNNPDVWHFEGGHTRTDWTATWAGNVDVDPAINSALAFTNNTAVDQTFITTLSLPTAFFIAPPSTILGGITVSVSGAGEVETLSTPAGDFMYRALTGSGGFVGAPADLLPSPFLLNSGPFGLPASFGPDTFGPVNGPGLLAVDSIGIRHAFTLTPGASATLNASFIIVPEPTAALALAPLAGLIFARRRRST